MKMRNVLLLCLMAVLATHTGMSADILSSGNTANIPEAGVPQELARWRKATYTDVRYRLHFDIPGERTERVGGRITVSLRLEAQADIVLDFREPASSVHEVSINGIKTFMTSIGKSEMQTNGTRGESSWADGERISRADGETPEAAQYYEAFYDNVPVSSESFCLGTRGSLLSTVGLHREHRTGENGLPEAVSDVFWFDDFALTAKADVPGTAADGTQTAIPAGTRIRAVTTDEASWVVFEPEHGGEPVKVEIDGADWPHTIQGEDMETYLEGLIFAG